MSCFVTPGTLIAAGLVVRHVRVINLTSLCFELRCQSVDRVHLSQLIKSSVESRVNDQRKTSRTVGGTACDVRSLSRLSGLSRAERRSRAAIPTPSSMFRRSLPAFGRRGCGSHNGKTLTARLPAIRHLERSGAAPISGLSIQPFSHSSSLYRSSFRQSTLPVPPPSPALNTSRWLAHTTPPVSDRPRRSRTSRLGLFVLAVGGVGAVGWWLDNQFYASAITRSARALWTG
jgi:hypothetical protein